MAGDECTTFDDSLLLVFCCDELGLFINSSRKTTSESSLSRSINSGDDVCLSVDVDDSPLTDAVEDGEAVFEAEIVSQRVEFELESEFVLVAVASARCVPILHEQKRLVTHCLQPTLLRMV